MDYEIYQKLSPAALEFHLFCNPIPIPTDFVRTRSRAAGIIFYGFPLHPPGKPTIERAEHLKEVKVPMLFLQGTKDELATLSLVQKVCSSLSLATLIKIEGANHAFKAGKQNIIPMLSAFTKEWIMKFIKSFLPPH